MSTTRSGRCPGPQTDLVFRDGHTGITLGSTPVGRTYRERFGADYWGVHRADLQRVLSEAVGPDRILLSHHVTGLREEDGRVLVDLADGSAVSGRIVVGADGARSTTRRSER